MLFDGNVYSTTSWTFHKRLLSSALGQFTSNAISLPNNLNLKKWNVDTYIQDTWKATSHFTVNVGLRWEHVPCLPRNVTNSVYNFSLGNLVRRDQEHSNSRTRLPALPFPGDPGFVDHTGQPNQWLLMAPRVAIAYDPKGDGKTVIRASFGISYDYTAGELTVNAADAPPYGGTEIWSGQFSNPYATLPGGNIFPYVVNANAPFANGGVYIATPNNFKTTSVNQWNLTVQRRIEHDWQQSAQYIGSESAHLLGSRHEMNPAVFIPGNCVAGQYGLTYAAPAPLRQARTTAGYSRWRITLTTLPTRM